MFNCSYLHNFNRSGSYNFARQTRKLSILLMVFSFVLSGCSSRFASPDGRSQSDRYQDSRYSIKQDKAPDKVLDGHKVKVVVPFDEPRSPGGNKSPYTVRGKSYQIIDRPDGWKQSGVASWYGAKFHGHKTSNGEIFDMYQVSAAHKTLPIPSYVKVTNLDNGHAVIARINDRGPFHDGRIIDLSYAGAVELGYQNLGTARIQIEVITGKKKTINKAHSEKSQSSDYYLQVGAFSEMDRARDLAARVRKFTKYVVYVDEGNLYRVKVGPMKHRSAEKLQKKLAKAELGPPIIVQ